MLSIFLETEIAYPPCPLCGIDGRTLRERELYYLFVSNIFNLAYVLISIAICISVFALIQNSKKESISILLLLPLSNFISASYLQIYDMFWSRAYSAKGVTEVFRLYFSNDSSMIFNFCYVPSIVIGTIIPLVAIAIFAFETTAK